MAAPPLPIDKRRQLDPLGHYDHAPRQDTDCFRAAITDQFCREDDDFRRLHSLTQRADQVFLPQQSRQFMHEQQRRYAMPLEHRQCAGTGCTIHDCGRAPGRTGGGGQFVQLLHRHSHRGRGKRAVFGLERATPEDQKGNRHAVMGLQRAPDLE